MAQSATADAWVIKEKLCWIQKASTPIAARWRITKYLKVMQAAVSEKPVLKPMVKALATLERHIDAVVRRWYSGLTNERKIGRGERPVSGGSFTGTWLPERGQLHRHNLPPESESLEA